ncbi:MAG: hypothetical protein J5701_04940 [Bacteroidales bacterium]|nr:hypothetical protein [Bacteroidales bacterium]
MNTKNIGIIIVSVLFSAYSIHAQDVVKPISTAKPVQKTGVTAGPPTIVYKVAKKYLDKVPINLNDEKTCIVSYPDPKDINESQLPTPLKKGYYLDNRGIGPNTVFLSLTYKEYATLQSAPDADQFSKLIMGKNPIKAMYDCGNRFKFKNLIEDLNIIIDNKFVDCKKLK